MKVEARESPWAEDVRAELPVFMSFPSNLGPEPEEPTLWVMPSDIHNAPMVMLEYPKRNLSNI